MISGLVNGMGVNEKGELVWAEEKNEITNRTQMKIKDLPRKLHFNLTLSRRDTNCKYDFIEWKLDDG